MKPEKKLLRLIAAIPADERLPIARFARELNCSQSVLIDMVQGLIAEGAMDARTVRPIAAELEPAAETDGASAPASGGGAGG
jgi:hypothetical protein